MTLQIWVWTSLTWVHGKTAKSKALTFAAFLSAFFWAFSASFASFFSCFFDFSAPGFCSLEQKKLSNVKCSVGVCKFKLWINQMTFSGNLEKDSIWLLNKLLKGHYAFNNWMCLAKSPLSNYAAWAAKRGYDSKGPLCRKQINRFFISWGRNAFCYYLVTDLLLSFLINRPFLSKTVSMRWATIITLAVLIGAKLATSACQYN